MQIDLLKALERASRMYNTNLLTIEQPFEGLENFDYGLRRTLYPGFDFARFGELILEKAPANTLVLTKDFTDSCYALFRLPDRPDAVYLFGPWRVGALKPEIRKQIAAEFDESEQIMILEYFNSMRCVEERTTVMWLSSLLSMVYPEGECSIRKLTDFLPLSPVPDKEQICQWAAQSELAASFAEERNRLEDAVVHAVTQGNLEAAVFAVHQLQRYPVREWTSSQLRNTKLQLLTGNARLSKAVGLSAVHPLYVERVYDQYIARIEGLNSIQEAQEMSYDMLRDYCECVTQHTLKDFSPLVQRVINHINLNLDTPLSLKSLAEMCCISPSYLSNLFKAETGVTLTDHITRQRIQRAAYLLINENDSVAQVGVRVGFLDDNYFTRTFKKIMGMPPTAYRKKFQVR